MKYQFVKWCNTGSRFRDLKINCMNYFISLPFQEFLKSRFRLSKDKTVPKQRVVEVVHNEVDSRMAPHLIGKAMGKAFGARIRPRGQAL